MIEGVFKGLRPYRDKEDIFKNFYSARCDGLKALKSLCCSMRFFWASSDGQDLASELSKLAIIYRAMHVREWQL